MSDYIDRQAAIEVLNKLARSNFTLKPGYEYYLGALHDAWQDIKYLPSADVEPVVRCKACANWNRETHGCLRNPSVSPWWEDDFCNYGARRDPEADYEWSEEEQAYIEQGYMDTQVGLPDLYMN